MEYLSCSDASKAMGFSVRRIQQMCKNGELPGAELLQRTMTIPTMANLLGISEGSAYDLIHRLHFRSVKTEYSSQRLLIEKASFYEWLKNQTHYKIVEGKEDFNDRTELSEAQ